MNQEIKIHPTALIHPKAQIGRGSEIGPYCDIGEHVVLGERCLLKNNVIINGHTTIGDDNQFFHHCVIGEAPQDKSYKGEPTRVEIGDRNIFREMVTVHRGTMKQDQVTKIGNDCYLMATAHIGHDVVLENKVLVVNTCLLAGHVFVGEGTTLAGGSLFSQFARVGRGCFIEGGTAVNRDVPPFCVAYGNRAKIKGMNIIGMRRLGFERKIISECVEFFKTMQTSGLSFRSFCEDGNNWQPFSDNSAIQEIVEFVRHSKLGMTVFEPE